MIVGVLWGARLMTSKKSVTFKNNFSQRQSFLGKGCNKFNG